MRSPANLVKQIFFSSRKSINIVVQCFHYKTVQIRLFIGKKKKNFIENIITA